MSSDRAREILAEERPRTYAYKYGDGWRYATNGRRINGCTPITSTPLFDEAAALRAIDAALSAPTPPPAVGDEEEEVRNALGGYSLKDGTLADSLSNFIGNLDVSAEVVDRHHLRSCAEEIERAVAVIKALAFARHRRASAFGGTVPREVQEILWQYESDLLHPPEGDSVQRRLDRVRKAILALQPNEEAGG